MQSIPIQKCTSKDIAAKIRNGAVVVLPTETAYGLIADATNKAAVERVYAIKKRDHTNPLPVVCGSIEQVNKFFTIPTQAIKLLEQHWPGPLSILLTAHNKDLFLKSDSVFVNTQGTDVAVRVTSHAFLQHIAQQLHRPLVATSANLAGHDATYNIDSVLAQLKTADAKPDLIIDGGVLEYVLPSTIIRIDNSGSVEVLRQGPIIISKL